jgi:hypothetical protein
MKIDLYTKAVLTVIAIALTGMACQNLLVDATAQPLTCGTPNMPCFVQNLPNNPLFVKPAPPLL